MALGNAKRFLDHLKSDKELQYRFEAFAAGEGYPFALNEIKITEGEELKECLKCGYKRSFSHLEGYENWVG
jgi:hypothetical protein